MEKLPLYSIGHGNRTREELLELLERYGIKFLIDVRTVPYSKYQPQYNREDLTTYMQDHNIRYVYMGDALGGRPKDTSCYNREGKIDYEALKTKEFYIEGIKRLKTAYEKQVPIAIMCSESKPLECHRSKLIGRTLLQENILLKHIDENGRLKGQEIIINELNKGKSEFTLFGEISDLSNHGSRKSYLDK